MTKITRRWTPENWAGLAPLGIGHQRPNNFAEVFRAVGENRDELLYAWRILNQGVCDGCALGTAGINDWTLNGVHLCNIRLRLLRLNTMPALNTDRLANADSLRNKKNEALREMGRLPYPMRRRAGEKGFERITWDEALDTIANKLKTTAPSRMGFYLTSRGMPNESYYAAQKSARAIGTNNIDNAARICHSPSTFGLKSCLGVAATTCSYSDWIDSDLVVFFGSNVANNQPVATKYLHYAKKNGCRVACVNNYREPGMEKYWIPSLPESALFGTKLTDRFFLINIGGDIAFIIGTLKHIIANDMCDESFVREHTTGFDDLKNSVESQNWEDLEDLSGVSRQEMLAFAMMIHEAKRAVFVWSMGITQHTHGVDNVCAIINLALTKGFVGRKGCGLMPIRGHSGVQGGAEMGCYATSFPGGLAVTVENARQLSNEWEFDVPSEQGMGATDMIDAASREELDVLFSAGGNFLEVLPEPDVVEEALEKIPLRVHMDIVLTNQMFVDAAEETILLPAATRYETPGGVTQTSTERRVIFSPEVPGRRIGEAQPEWQVFSELAARVKPELREKVLFSSTSKIREEIAQVIPFYDGIQYLDSKGDQFQYGGKHLCSGWNFPTKDGKAHFQPVEPPQNESPEGRFLVATRRGKQFNSLLHESKDSITGALREAVLMNAKDAKALGVDNGDEVLLKNELGELRGHVHVAPVKPGNLQVHWPEGNVLIDRRRREPMAGVPDYNAVVTVEKVT